MTFLHFIHDLALNIIFIDGVFTAFLVIIKFVNPEFFNFINSTFFE